MFKKSHYLQFLRLLVVLLSLLFFACRNNLEEKLLLTEQRILLETAFGKQMRDNINSKNTRYILDPSLPYQTRYSIADDSIHYNPGFFAYPRERESISKWGLDISTEAESATEDTRWCDFVI
jgi:hypothetical protein